MRALVILDHGSRRPDALEHVERVARAVGERAPHLRVEVAHLELSPPSLSEIVGRLVADGVREIAVHPFFLVPGRHLEHDVPELVRTAQSEHPGLAIELLDALGSSPELPDLVLRTLRR